MIRAMSTEIARQTRKRPSLAAEDRDLARQVGVRLKAARTRAGLTQRQLAEPRYTKAYISALENGLIKPSMAALRFLARRLGTVPEAFLADADTHWERLDAELRLAAGDWQPALDRFQSILDTDPQGVGRGLCLLGMAEAAYRLGRSFDAIGYAGEARELLTAANRIAEAQRATYWLSAAHHASNDLPRARMLLEELLASMSPTTTDPDLRVRVLVALAMNAFIADDASTAISLLEEARSIGADLDDRRRATLLYSLAQSYRLAGDLEGAVRSGTESLALWKAIDARGEMAGIENELALIYLDLGNLSEAEKHLSAGRSDMESVGDDFRMAHLVDTDARIALERGDPARAERLAADATALAERAGNTRARLSSLVTAARAARRAGRPADAAALLENAAELAESAPPNRLREVLTEWSELAAESGDHARAYELTRRALAIH
jgi:tetratricopeptide (TPR) repeat protein